LLDRYGIVARELVRREPAFSWPSIVVELQRMELRGEIRRGYFVEGLSGMQFARPDAVEMLRVEARDSGERVTLLLNTTDPANPISTPLPEGFPEGARLTRGAQNYAGFHNGQLAVIIENYGSRIWVSAHAGEPVMRECMEQLLNTGVRTVRTQYVNGERPAGTGWEKVLRSIGFYRDKDQTMRISRFS
jgi:ATP-dependent Lhr-like helicase